MDTVIKEKNYYCLKDFASGRSRSEMTATRITALLKLIDRKGVLFESNHTVIGGKKILKISEKEFIACISTPLREGSNLIQTFLLTII